MLLCECGGSWLLAVYRARLFDGRTGGKYPLSDREPNQKMFGTIASDKR